MKKSLSAALCATLIGAGALALVHDARAQDKALTGRQIMEMAEKKNRAKDETIEAEMKIYEGKTLSKERKLSISMKTADGYEDRSLFRFSDPGDIRGTGFLTHQHGKKEDDQWIYLPAVKKTKRIASGEKKNSFVGSDYAYEDLRTENLDIYDYKLVKKEVVKKLKKECYVIDAMATTDEEKRNSGYSRRRLWISVEDLQLRRVDYFRADGDKDLLKTQFFVGFKALKGWKGFMRPTRAYIVNKKKKTKSEFIFGKRQIDTGLGDDAFSERALTK